MSVGCMPTAECQNISSRNGMRFEQILKITFTVLPNMKRQTKKVQISEGSLSGEGGSTRKLKSSKEVHRVFF